MTDLDAIRARFPHVTLNVYAPAGGDVALEVLDGDESLGLFEGRTLAACLRRAFPADEEVRAAPEPTVDDLFA